MQEGNPLGNFLRARREHTGPDSVDLPPAGRRRVPGLRRDEVAVLAGVSTDYYVRLEQGRERNPSAEVINALARVFRLDDDALAHLRRLARPQHSCRESDRVGPGLVTLMKRWHDTPAIVQNRYGDVLACTALALAIHPSLVHDRNLVRLLFLDPAEQALFPDWEDQARQGVAWLRADADPGSSRLTALVGELSLKSPAFARLWARHDVRVKSRGLKRFAHPVVGTFTVDFETFQVSGQTGQSLTVYHAAPGTSDADALTLLASHAATPSADRAETPRDVIVVDRVS